MKKLMIALMLCISLSGCANTSYNTQPIPSSFMEPCDDLELLKGKDGKACMNVTIDNAEIHYACRDKYYKLIEAVKIRQR